MTKFERDGLAKRATITDVAKIADVSAMTVSRVMRNTKDVKESTRNRVQVAISQLNYHPDFSARALSNHITGNIGFLVSHKEQFENLFTYLAFTLEDNLYTRDYSIITSMQSLDPTHLPVLITQRKVDGLIAAGCTVNKSLLAECELNGIPVVMIEGFVEDENITTIHPDYKVSTRKAVEFLVSQGHKHFVFMGNDPDNKNDLRKIKYITKALNSFGLDLSKQNIFFTNRFDSSEKKLMESMKQKDENNTAYFCVNENLAAQLNENLRTSRLTHPIENSIIVFADSKLENFKHLFNEITVAKKKIVEIAVQELFKKINKQPIEEHHIHVPTLFINRESLN